MNRKKKKNDVLLMREVERDRAVLESILALSLSLAALAIGAASAPDHIRFYVLDCLAHGEAAARDMLIGMAAGRSSRAARVDCGDAGPPDEIHPADDPALIAATLRVLALALVAMLAETAGRSPRRLARPTGRVAGIVRRTRRQPAPACRPRLRSARPA